jgi:hypothetical protein
MINLASHVEELIKESIAIALDKANAEELTM